MRRPPDDIEQAAIGRLLVLRARAGELGFDLFNRPLCVRNGRNGWLIGTDDKAYALSHPQAAAVALGEYSIDEVPNGSALYKAPHVIRYPRLDEPFVPLQLARKPAQKEKGASPGSQGVAPNRKLQTRSELIIPRRKAARGGS